jgi:DNA primase small subunit
MLERNLNLVNNAIKEYYFKNFELVEIPARISEREFGYQKFNEGMIRHLSIKDVKELHLLLMTKIPSDMYCSNAYYSFPNLPMPEKDWKGADLIFDIDAKDLNLECRTNHTFYKCTSCQNIVESETNCTICKSTKLETIALTCTNCVDKSKKEVMKLLEILIEDFGIRKDDVKVYFSGNEGFHVYVINSDYQTLGSRERTDLADYIMFNGMLPETLGVNKQTNTKFALPSVDEAGWKGRIAREMFGSKFKRAKIVHEIQSGGYFVFQAKLADWRSKVGVSIDSKVTMDIHRIFRLGGTINSKSGLSKIMCSDLKNFDPFSDACLLDDEKVEVIANCPFSFKLKNKKHGPYEKEKITVPKHVAVYLICKGCGEVC